MRLTWLSTPNWSPSPSCALPIWSAASESSPRRIAVSAAASTRRSPGPSSRRWPRAPHWPAGNYGAEEGEMRRSSDHIVTSHVGSLPRPDTLIEANRAREAGEAIDESAFRQHLLAAVTDVVRHQCELRIDIPNDGEFGKSVTHRVHYGAWWNYAFSRWGGIEFGAPGTYGTTPRRSR